ncbi:PTS sugar transporter subunit IIA [Lacticaseibacillus saniviri]
MKSQNYLPFKYIEATKLSRQELMVLIHQQLQPELSDLSVEQIAALIEAREQQSDTYIGDGTMLLHLDTTQLRANRVLIINIEDKMAWQSAQGPSQYQISHILVLAVNQDLAADMGRIRQLMTKLVEEDFFAQLHQAAGRHQLAAVLP